MQKKKEDAFANLSHFISNTREFILFYTHIMYLIITRSANLMQYRLENKCVLFNLF